MAVEQKTTQQQQTGGPGVPEPSVSAGGAKSNAGKKKKSSSNNGSNKPKSTAESAASAAAAAAAATATTSPSLNGHQVDHPSASSAKAKTLEETAESHAAQAAIDIVENKDDTNAQANGNKASPATRALAKRVKAITKKLQRISQYEDLPAAQLNEDQRKAIASKPTQHAVLKELQEVAKALDQAEKEKEAELQAQAQEENKREQRSGQASGDANLVLIQQILRLFTLLHVPQISPSFAPTISSSLLQSITSQEAAAIGKLYQDIIEHSLYTGAEDETALAGETSVQQVLSLVDTASSQEIIQGVTFARVKDLVSQLVVSPAGQAASKPPQASSEEQQEQDDVAKQNQRKDDELTREVAQIAPEVVDAPASQPKVNGSNASAAHSISFLQSSEVGEEQKAVDAPAEVASALEPEGGVVDGAPVVSGEKTAAGADAAKGTVIGQETPTTAAPPAQKQQPAQPARIDWSADVDDDDDDLGDPLDAFPDQRPPAVAAATTTAPQPASSTAAASSAAASAHTPTPVSAAPLQAKQGQEPSTPPLTPAVSNSAGKPQNSAAPKQQQHIAAPKRGPVVDEDGFVVQVSKKTLHQQAQQAARGGQGGRGGRGRGRGRGGSSAGAGASTGAGNAENRDREGGAGGRGRGRGRGGSGRGGASAGGRQE